MMVRIYSKALVLSAVLMLTSVLDAQTDNSKKAQQISNLKEVIRVSTDANEIAKARQALQVLEGENNETNTRVVAPVPVSQKTQQQLDFEEQKHASETLSATEYDIWKKNKLSQRASQQSAQ